MQSYGSFVALYSKDISLNMEDFSILFFAFHSLNLPPLTYNCAFLKKKNSSWNLTVLNFCRKFKYLNLFFFKKGSYRQEAKNLKSGLQKTELKNLPFSTRYLQNRKRQNSHRITRRREENQTCLTESLKKCLFHQYDMDDLIFKV